MLETLISSLLSLRYYILLSLILIHYLSNYYKLGLHRYPGPLWAKFTNLWRFIDVSGRRPEVTHIALHRKYGDVVRLGPNVLSFADPKAIKGIYGLNKGFVKSEFYPVQMALSKGQPLPSLFSARDETFHANLRRSVNSAFSMSALVQYEPMVDSTTALFLDQTDRLFASQDRICDFSRWLQFYAFDVIGSITYSRRHGFVDRNEDVEGIVESLGAIFDYSGPIGQMPWLDYVFWKNPFLHLLAKLGIRENSTPVARFAVARMQERLLSTTTTAQDSKHSQTDLLSMFLQAQKARPEFMTDKRVLTMATSMAFAGSETTAISLAAVFYHLLKNPTCLRKLLHELDTAVENGTIANRANGLVSWKESQTLTYLDACIKEAFRMHPSAGLPLERIVPPAGAEIAGYNIPAGTIVGCSAWVIHRRPEIFGADVDVYRPERWLLRQQQARLKEMNACMFHFGAGARTCIGKNISLMEVYKLVPSFLRRFEVHFADPSDTWKLHNAWFVRQLNFRVKFRAKKIEGATS
ncbi:hypothetical protein AJ80_06781 [Polytolypa hystricis UAMH7299]|uniref:Cytochrome P450 oxidoreductase n=1 Tax=Polytolypa hystricis (strain UAMH7299) TaxID=1447883 RepID=A0A2B7XUW0_POLH7|nr:hypothetical protein AJ80_06781 [Polytolypa hystricis UAMH7299]